jgi:hypothetical protein
MICAAGLACRQLAVLDINANPVSQLDDLLLFICIPSFFLYGIFSIVPAMAYSNYMALFVAILQVNILEKEIIVWEKKTKNFPIAQRRKIIAQLNFVDLNFEWCPISEGDSSHPANAHNHRRPAPLQPQCRNAGV